jgi:hypothetical protein
MRRAHLKGNPNGMVRRARIHVPLAKAAHGRPFLTNCTSAR